MVRWAFADSPVGVQTQKYTTVGSGWHVRERQTADREIISSGAAALWELSSAAALLLWDRGQGLLQETFHREN